MSLKNLLSLKKYSFLKRTIDSNVILTPLSQQIKQNIANEWIKCIRCLPSVEVFVTPMITQTDPMTKNQINSLKSILENYKNYYRNWSEFSDESIGIIQKFISFNDNNNNKNNFFNSSKNDCLVFTLFSKKQESLHWFQKLQGIHNQWFRNLSKSPLKSKFCSEIDENTKNWVLSYKSEEFDQQLETIKYFGDSSAKEEYNLKDLDLISCNIDLDNTLIGFLFDGFTKKVDTNGKTLKKMKFHSSLAPFKIGFTFRENTQINEVLNDLTSYLISSLKEFDIPVLPFNPTHFLPIQNCDELGVPFTVILDNESIRDGVITLRNRDSEIEESVHISRFQQTICLYLKVIHPSNIRNKY